MISITPAAAEQVRSLQKDDPTRSFLRVYVAGHLPNTPPAMEEWIRHPRDVNPRTAMPDTGVTVTDARDIAAYLYTLR